MQANALRLQLAWHSAAGEHKVAQSVGLSAHASGSRLAESRDRATFHLQSAWADSEVVLPSLLSIRRAARASPFANLDAKRHLLGASMVSLFLRRWLRKQRSASTRCWRGSSASWRESYRCCRHSRCLVTLRRSLKCRGCFSWDRTAERSSGCPSWRPTCSSR